MKFGILFTIIGALFAAAAVMHQGWAWLLIWPAVSFALVGQAYLWLGAGIYGKRSSGSMSLISMAILLPALIYFWTVWHLLRRIKREPPYDELLPGVLIGRRLLGHELPADVTLVVDLTCEFPEPGVIRTGRTYVHFPILDGFVPQADDVLSLLQVIREHQGRTYVHCAEGHGRTGLIAAGLLLHLGLAQTAAEAIRLVQAKRPRVRLGRQQQRIVAQLEADITGSKPNAATST